MSTLSNCVVCGSLFLRTSKLTCPNCLKKVEMDFKKCQEFLRVPANRNATITTLSDVTGVSVSQINEFIKEGRILTRSFPNMVYPCDVCGKPVERGTKCSACIAALTSELKSAQEDLSKKAVASNPKNYSSSQRRF